MQHDIPLIREAFLSELEKIANAVTLAGRRAAAVGKAVAKRTSEQAAVQNQLGLRRFLPFSKEREAWKATKARTEAVKSRGKKIVGRNRDSALEVLRTGNNQQRAQAQQALREMSGSQKKLKKDLAAVGKPREKKMDPNRALKRGLALVGTGAAAATLGPPVVRDAMRQRQQPQGQYYQ